ncbi:YdcF family protein [Shewanella gelidii]|nr:ElyC/SanA/YdcF family protein [Shewanella gelidii]MCL1096384.1 YdcF family protein [Shewanella gelidii]
MFWVKKMASMLMMPISVFIILLLFSMVILYRRPTAARILLSSVIGLLLLLSSQLGVNLIVAPLEQQYSVNSEAVEHECIVLVLGSGHSTSPDLPPLQKLSSTALARLMEGVRQLQLGEHCTLVTSGWSGDESLDQVEHSHAYIAAQAALELGVSEQQIYQQPRAKDTIEEALWFKQRFADAPFRIVTSATHMPRAMSIFHQQGLYPSPAPTDFIARDGLWWRLEAENLYRCQRAIHEYIGRLWFWLKTHVL